jgi:hypothetical protein
MANREKILDLAFQEVYEEFGITAQEFGEAVNAHCDEF